jgi:xylan 1,4-beta-xylosidase
VLVWNYHDDDVPAEPSPVAVTVDGIPGGRVLLHHYRIDHEHSNAYEAWKAMGSPQDPTPQQYAELERASELALLESPRWLDVATGRVTVPMSLPRQGVSLLRLSWSGTPID